LIAQHGEEFIQTETLLARVKCVRKRRGGCASECGLTWGSVAAAHSAAEAVGGLPAAFQFAGLKAIIVPSSVERMLKERQGLVGLGKI